MKAIAQLGSADKREVNPSSNKLFHILNISYVQSSVLATEWDTAGREVEGPRSTFPYTVLAYWAVILISSPL